MSGRNCQWGGCGRAATVKLLMVGVSGTPDGWFCEKHAAIHVEAGAGKVAR